MDRHRRMGLRSGPYQLARAFVLFGLDIDLDPYQLSNYQRSITSVPRCMQVWNVAVWCETLRDSAMNGPPTSWSETTATPNIYSLISFFSFSFFYLRMLSDSGSLLGRQISSLAAGDMQYPCQAMSAVVTRPSTSAAQTTTLDAQRQSAATY